MNKKSMMAGISAVAFTIATVGCAPLTEALESSNIEQESKDSKGEEKMVSTDCEKMELVQGDAYSGDEKEVWYCNDEKSPQHGSFFMPFLAGYMTSQMLQSNHNMNVSNYKPGSSSNVVSSKQYNELAPKPLPKQVKSHTKNISTMKSSKGFGSSTIKSGG